MPRRHSCNSLPTCATAINQMDAFYIKIGNLAKGKKPEITPALYTTLYNDYAMVMGSLGGTVKPAQLRSGNRITRSRGDQ